MGCKCIGELSVQITMCKCNKVHKMSVGWNNLCEGSSLSLSKGNKQGHFLDSLEILHKGQPCTLLV